MTRLNFAKLLNIVSFGPPDHPAGLKKVTEGPTMGIHTQNVLAYIPILNLVVGGQRIARSVKHLKNLPNHEKFLTNQDKSEKVNCKHHIIRGAVELIPGAGLIFLVPDIFFSIVRAATNKIKSGNSNDPNTVNNSQIPIDQSPYYGSVKISGIKGGTPQDNFRKTLYKQVEDLRQNHTAIRRLIHQTHDQNASGFTDELKKFLSQHFEILKQIQEQLKLPFGLIEKQSVSSFLRPIAENGVNTSFKNGHTIKFNLPIQYEDENVQTTINEIIQKAFDEISPPVLQDQKPIYFPDPDPTYYPNEGYGYTTRVHHDGSTYHIYPDGHEERIK